MGAGQTAPVLPFLLYPLACALLCLLVRAGLDDRELEIALLRHQLRVLTRRGKRTRYGPADRAFFAAVSRFLPRQGWRVPGRPRHSQALAQAARGQEGPKAAPPPRTWRSLVATSRTMRLRPWGQEAGSDSSSTQAAPARLPVPSPSATRSPV